MYELDWRRLRTLTRSLADKAAPRVSRTVYYLGLTSLFTDISSEMVANVLPVYLVLYIGMSPLQFGLVDGLYQGTTALMRLASGFLADRWQRQKEVAAAGYGLAAMCKVALLAAGSSWTAIAATIALDRTGKGIRTAPRDALIAQSTPKTGLATAFGVHRAMDAAGAMIGPLTAFLLLSRFPNRFDLLFVISFCVALIGLGVLLFFVDSKRSGAAESHRPLLQDVWSLMGDRRFRGLVIAGGALSLATVSDSFIYLVLQRSLQLNPAYFPLLYFATSLFYVILAVPAGRLADRWGRPRIFLGGYVLLLTVYAIALTGHGHGALLAVCLLMMGAYYAATDGVLMAMGSAVLPERVCTSGLALITTVVSVARLAASLAFGWAWNSVGNVQAGYMFLLGLTAALAISWSALRERRSPELLH